MRSDWIPAVTHTDRLIGATLGKLASLNMSESTAVVVIGDHGYELGEHNMWVSHGSSLSTPTGPHSHCCCHNVATTYVHHG